MIGIVESNLLILLRYQYSNGLKHFSDSDWAHIKSNSLVHGIAPLLYYRLRADDTKRHVPLETMDCLKHFRARVTGENRLEASALDAVDAEVMTLIDEAVDAAKNSPLPEAVELLTDVYATY